MASKLTRIKYSQRAMTGIEKHRKTRKAQAENKDSHHHPVEKIAQLKRFEKYISGSILEVFAGKGNLTKYYTSKGNVTAMTREIHGDSFHAIYELRANRKKFNVIDIDGYGYPNKFFPVVFEMMKKRCLLIFTFPVIGVQCINGIYEQNYITFWGNCRPTTGDVVGRITDFALREWRLAKLIDVEKIKPIWRFIFLVDRVKATDMTHTKNR